MLLGDETGDRLPGHVGDWGITNMLVDTSRAYNLPTQLVDVEVNHIAVSLLHA